MERAGASGAPAFSAEWTACLVAEAEALLAERVSAAVRARWRREVKLPRMSLEGCLEQLSEARRGRAALLGRPGPLAEAQQERLQTFLRLEMALLREVRALRERALASAFAVAKKGETGPSAATAAHPTATPPPTGPGGGEAEARDGPGEAAGGARVVSAAEAASRAKAAAQREALAEALWEPGGVGDLIARGGDLRRALEQLLGERLGAALRGLERAVRGEGRARVRRLLGVREALLGPAGGWAERAGALRGEARALRGAGRPGALREKAAALRDCLAEAPLEQLRPALEAALALLEKTDSWWVAWLEKALWAAPLEEAEAARREAQTLSAALQPDGGDGQEEAAAAGLLGALGAGEGAEGSASPRWGSLEEMRDALQSAPFDEVFALLKQPRALRQALQESPEAEEQEELLAVLGALEEAFGRVRLGDWREQLSALRVDRWEEEATVLLEKVWALKTEAFLLASDLDREEKVAVLAEQLRALYTAAAAAPLADRELLREKLAALQTALLALPVREVLLLQAKAKALRKAATDFWTEPLAEVDALLAEADVLREALTGSPLQEALWPKAEELRGALREIAKKKISVLSYYLWNVLWSPLWKKVGDMQRALWKTPRKEEGAVQEKLADLEHALDEILEDNLSGLPRILYALPGIVTALQKKVHAVRESLQETPPEMAVALQGKVVAMQEALWKIPFKEAHLMQEDLKAYCLTLQRKVEAWWARPLEAAPAKAPPRTERREAAWIRRGTSEPAAAASAAAEVAGTRQPSASSPARPATDRAPSPPTGEAAAAVGAGRFQYSALRAIPHSHFQQRKDWYENTDQDLRDYVVQRLVHAVFPASDLTVLKGHQVEKVVSYAKKVEGDVYQSTNHWDVYCCLIMVKLFNIEKELREKRTFRGTTADGPAQPLSIQLAGPEVPLSPTEEEPPGVGQLNPMSIWTIQNTLPSLDPPGDSPVNPPARTDDEEAALAVASSPPWMPQPQTVSGAPSASGQLLPPHVFPAPHRALDTSGAFLGESVLQGGGVQGLDPASPLSYSAAPLPPHTSPGAQSPSASVGSMAAAAPSGLSPETPPQQPCPKSDPEPGTLGEPHFGTREASSHGLLGKRRRLVEGAWRAPPASSSHSASPDGPAQPPPVTLESLQRSLEDLRISVLRNLGAVHRQVEALEKRIHTLERWRAETEGRRQLPPP